MRPERGTDVSHVAGGCIFEPHSDRERVEVLHRSATLLGKERHRDEYQQQREQRGLVDDCSAQMCQIPTTPVVCLARSAQRPIIEQ